MQFQFTASDFTPNRALASIQAGSNTSSHLWFDAQMREAIEGVRQASQWFLEQPIAGMFKNVHVNVLVKSVADSAASLLTPLGVLVFKDERSKNATYTPWYVKKQNTKTGILYLQFSKTRERVIITIDLKLLIESSLTRVFESLRDMVAFVLFHEYMHAFQANFMHERNMLIGQPLMYQTCPLSIKAPIMFYYPEHYQQAWSRILLGSFSHQAQMIKTYQERWRECYADTGAMLLMSMYLPNVDLTPMLSFRQTGNVTHQTSSALQRMLKLIQRHPECGASTLTPFVLHHVTSSVVLATVLDDIQAAFVNPLPVQHRALLRHVNSIFQQNVKELMFLVSPTQIERLHFPTFAKYPYVGYLLLLNDRLR